MYNEIGDIMKIIIAPSKLMKDKKATFKTTTPIFIEKQKKLKELLKTYSIEELHDMMKISFKQAALVYQNYHEEDTLHPALYRYAGTVFSKLKVNTYKEEQLAYLDKYVTILSAYYGVLKYSDAISKYRLDMKMKVRDINLYAYWRATIQEYFKNEDMIICLASKEFANMVKHPNIITIDFVEERAGHLVCNAVKVKQARGMMLNIMIKENITTLEQIKRITFDGYSYNSALSASNEYLVFYRTLYNEKPIK